MKITIKELSQRIARKAGIRFEAHTLQELSDFVRELVPLIRADFVHGTVDFTDFWKWYEGDCMIPFFSMELEKEAAIRLVRETGCFSDFKFDNVAFYAVASDNDVDFDMEYQSPEEVPSSQVYVDTGYSCKINEVLNRFRLCSRKLGMTLKPYFYNIYPYGDGSMEWTVENGVLSGGIKYHLTDSEDGEDLLVTLCRIGEVFGDLSDAELDEIGVELDLDEKPDACGKYDLIECGKKELFRLHYDLDYHDADTPEQKIALVDRYPILYSGFVAKGDSDRDLLVHFLQANLTYREKLDALYQMMETDAAKEHLHSVNGIHADNPELFLNGYTKEENEEWYQPYLDDAEVFHLLAESGLSSMIKLTSETYREDLLVKEMKAGHGELVSVAYAFWKKEIGKRKDLVETLRARYLLTEDTSDEILAFYQCYDLVKKVKSDAMAELALMLQLFTDEKLHALFWNEEEQWRPVIRRLFQTLSPDQRDWLCDTFCLFNQFREPAEFTPKLVETIIQKCPCAPLVLSEEAILANHIRIKNVAYRDVCEICEICKHEWDWGSLSPTL